MGQFSYLAWCCEHETELTCSTHLLTYHTMQTFYDLGGGKEGKKEGREGEKRRGGKRGRREGGRERKGEKRERERGEGEGGKIGKEEREREGEEEKGKQAREERKSHNPKMLAIKKVYVYTPSPPPLTLHLQLCVP